MTQEKIRLHIDQPLAAGQALALSEGQANYLFAVMRLSLGATLAVFGLVSRRSLETLAAAPAPQPSGRILRDWLTKIPGIGFKTASWVARNWLDADDVAILDIHILRAGVLAGFFDAELTVERHYRELEDQFLAFSAGLGVRASELDALMWYEMMASRNSVAQILSAMPESAFKARHAPSRPPANPERPHARQLALIR